MTNHTPQGLPPLPAAFGYLCDWGNDSLGLTRQTVYYGEPGSATENDWNEFPKVHKNEPIFTAGQIQAYAREALAAQAASVKPVASVLYLSDTGLCSEISEELPWGMDLYASAPPSPVSVPGETPGRTDQQIIDQTNEVAALLAEAFQGSVLPSGEFHKATNVKAQRCWQIACHIQEILTDTDPENSVSELDSQLPAPSPATAVMQVGCENIDGTLNIHPEMETCSICEPAQAVDAEDEWEAFQVWRTRQQVIADNRAEGDDWIDAAKQVDGFIAGYRAALQASRQPQAQQDGGAAMREALRMGVECLRNWKTMHPEDFDELDELAVALLKAALATTKEPK